MAGFHNMLSYWALKDMIKARTTIYKVRLDNSHLQIAYSIQVENDFYLADIIYTTTHHEKNARLLQSTISFVPYRSLYLNSVDIPKVFIQHAKLFDLEKYLK